MSEIKWSDAQKKAFGDRGLGVVVSAAAGSGKTAVLIERIIRMITDEEKPVRLDKMLVVTFTKAAAAEIQARLRKAFREKLSENPNNRLLLSQQKLLPFADICNNDKFYNSLVRNNFHILGVAPDFRMVDNAEEKIFKNEAVQQVLEEAYENNSEAFRNLIGAIGCERDDGVLADIIKSLNENANSHIDPEAWLNSVKDAYSGSQSVENTVFGEIILGDIGERLDYCEQLLKASLKIVDGCEGLEKAVFKFTDDLGLVESFQNLVNEKKWDELKNTLDGLTSKKLFADYPTVKGDIQKSAEKINSHALYKRFRAVFDNLEGAVPVSSEEYNDDAALLYPAVSELIGLVRKFRQAYDEQKAQVNALDFNDVTHLVLRLLFTEDGKPSKYALELREKYDEILIDEYQDTNEAQDAIFTAISRDERNLFLVGDVKQSIYAFRLAMPQIFIDKTKRWHDGDQSVAEHINLDSNYRSREAILHFVNFVFERSMSEKAGDIDYGEAESLKYGAKYPADSNSQVELDIINKASAGDYSKDSVIVDRIKSILENEKVYNSDKEEMRPVKLSDICVLCRTNGECERIAKTLRENGISAYYEEKRGFFGSVEINTVVSFLRLLDNPLQDVPLLSVLMSPIYGFDADDIARMRVGCRKGMLFEAVRKSGDEKCKRFIESYYNYRRLSSVMSVVALLHEIYNQTGYYTVVGAMTDGEIRKLNLIMLLEYASSYESYSDLGLSGFVRYLDDCQQSKAEFKPAVKISQNADVVNVMTVHKSKGLEFPIVLLEGSKLNVDDGSGYIINEKFGIGLKVCQSEKFIKYTTAQYCAAQILKKNQEYSETMRVLYVALTRAREKLVIIERLLNSDTRFGNTGFCGLLDKLHPVEVKSCDFSSAIILKSLFTHPCTQAMRDASGLDIPVDQNEKSGILLNIINEAPVQAEAVAEEKEKSLPDSELVRLIGEKALYKYPYESVSLCTTKKSASAFNIDSSDTFRFFANEKPKFAVSGELTGAQKGTAMHRFMEVCDFEKAEADAQAERDRLVKEKLLSAEQGEVLNVKAVERFFESEVYSRMKASPKVLREQKFTVFVPADFVNPDLGEAAKDEKVLVQGVIDCAFFENGKIVILDYKTDRVSEASKLRELYHRQLEVYKIAAEESFNAEVSEMLLYSFALGEQVKL